VGKLGRRRDGMGINKRMFTVDIVYWNWNWLALGIKIKLKVLVLEWSFFLAFSGIWQSNVGDGEMKKWGWIGNGWMGK
jgi:hypothetical protein